MKLANLEVAVNVAIAATESQNQYVLSLGTRIQNGEKMMKVYDDLAGVWTDVKIEEFWQIQYDKYLAMSGYSGEMHGLMTNLQTALDAAIANIVLPDDRIKAAAAAKAATQEE